MARTVPRRGGRKHIVVIGGGTGVFNVLTGLKRTGHDLAAIVTMADDGGSTGVLREEFGILPPGDVRRALVALSHAEKTLAELFAYRFKEGKGLEGHSIGNLLLTALERMTGSFERAIDEAGKMLQIEGAVIPVTLDDVRLKAWLEGGTVLVGERVIDAPSARAKRRIRRVALTRKARPNPRALKAIAEAHLIVIGPGDLFTSLLPNLVVPGIAKAIRVSHAKKAYVVNLMTKRGETDGFTAKDFIEALERVLGKGALDAVVVNRSAPSARLVSSYRKHERAEPVFWSRAMFREAPYRVIAASLLRQEGRFIRHDPQKLARALLQVLR